MVTVTFQSACGLCKTVHPKEREAEGTICPPAPISLVRGCSMGWQLRPTSSHVNARLILVEGCGVRESPEQEVRKPDTHAARGSVPKLYQSKTYYHPNHWNKKWAAGWEVGYKKGLKQYENHYFKLLPEVAPEIPCRWLGDSSGGWGGGGSWAVLLFPNTWLILNGSSLICFLYWLPSSWSKCLHLKTSVETTVINHYFH